MALQLQCRYCFRLYAILVKLVLIVLRPQKNTTTTTTTTEIFLCKTTTPLGFTVLQFVENILHLIDDDNRWIEALLDDVIQNGLHLEFY